MRASLLLSGLLSLAASGCARPEPAAPSPAFAALRYEARLVGASPTVLDVSMDITGGAETLEADAPEGIVALEVQDDAGRRVPVRQGRMIAIDCRGSCRVFYRYDLSSAARASGGSFGVAVESGGDVVAPGSTWMLRPAPLAPHVPVSLQVRVPDGLRFSSGLRRGEEEGTFALRSEELRTLGFTAFGAFTSLRVEATSGAVEVAILRGKRAASDAQIERWIGDTARALDHVFGRFPVRRASLVVVPTKDDDTYFGRTLPSGGPSIAIAIAEHADASALARDWVLAHELFHLGVPSFWNEGVWLDEGLATYYEPILRARANMVDRRAVWDAFAREMPRGLAHDGGSLAEAHDNDRIYWGGAIFALRADIEIRKRTGGARSLDDGLRRALDLGGDATHVWPLSRYLRVLDEATGVPVMRTLYAEARGERPSANCSSEGRVGAWAGMLVGGASCPTTERDQFVDLLRALGVHRTSGGVTFSDDAPLAHLRHDLVTPSGGAPRPTPFAP
ncbi:hypothetical protein [Polyangium aurulentum]|uniref:hypothetical protein n=1 Tax=Polyangium aurulentum TaxID=2567896 RepID=UPI0010ADCA5C|nr:hypothetical protein [Polyangium aurulentum]UQA57349.1 hypothetical protein E8A73_039655 [Polyangium aurulentum]